jgi:hypothetical protein
MSQMSSLFYPNAFFASLGLLCATSTGPIHAQTPAAPPVSISTESSTPSLTVKNCILAGRLNSYNRWAPLFPGVILLNDQGERLRDSSKKSLATVKAVRLIEPALLSQCNGNQPLVSDENSSGVKAPTTAVKPDPSALTVEMIYYPPLRAGGQWVELQLVLPANRVIALVR